MWRLRSFPNNGNLQKSLKHMKNGQFSVSHILLLGVGLALLTSTLYSVATYNEVVKLGESLESQSAVQPEKSVTVTDATSTTDLATGNTAATTDIATIDTATTNTAAATTATISTNSTMNNNNNICEGYEGIMHIREADEYAACGTVFFLHMVNQILYAHRYNLIPFIHLNNRSYHVRDSQVHGSAWRTLPVQVVPIGPVKGRPALPGDPQFNKVQAGEMKLMGNGVWDSYFEPPAGVTEDTIQHDTSCHKLPVVTLGKGHVFPGIHYYADWSVKAWVYKPGKPGAPKKGQSLQDWFQPMRQQAHDIVQRYHRPLPFLQEAVHNANPHVSSPGNQCLSIHVRLTDKAAGRKKLSLQDFEPYAKAFVQAGAGKTLFIATDDARIIPEIQKTWSANIGVNLTVHFQQAAKRSSSKVATFLTAPHHRINTEALVDIYGMAHCDCMIHGYSAMSESAQYVHYPQLHECSVNLEMKDHMSPAGFEQLLRKQKEQ